MGGDRVLAQPLAELVGDPLGQLPGVDEHERGAVVGDVGGDAVEDLADLLAGDGRLELAVGQLEREVEAAPVPGVDDGRERLARPTSRRAAVSIGLRRREADADGRRVGHGLEPLEREGEVRAALVAGHGVDLVDDHRLDGARGWPGTARRSGTGTATRAW